ncbi:hypothetical protein [Geitlerinema sp. PCC 9228]|uniref:hypothetical protein n=1 Tax=Geitlerinema sp. PCC 9228 TaxID=111611 RepID=UPI0008F9E226|nr:hypothetical protein [Geitlerinema sp. PCC 9228]
MSSPSLADLQSLLHEIDEALSEQPPRLRLGLTSKDDRQRQLLERTREFLVALQSQWSQPSAAGHQAASPSPQENSPENASETPSVETWRSQLQTIRATLLGSIQTELDELQQQRQELLREIRQLEAKRAQYYSLAAQQDQQQQAIAQFLERLLERLQPTLKAQMAKTLKRLETQFLSLEAAPSEISSVHRWGLAATEAETGSQPSSGEYPLHPADRLQKLRQLQAQSDRMLQDLDATMQVVFDSLLQNTRSYEQSLSQSLSQMYNLGQQGENMIAALVEAIAERAQNLPSPETESSEKTTVSPPTPPTAPKKSGAVAPPEPSPVDRAGETSPTHSPSSEPTETEPEPTTATEENSDRVSSNETATDPHEDRFEEVPGTSEPTSSDRSEGNQDQQNQQDPPEAAIENDYSDIEALEASLFASDETTTNPTTSSEPENSLAPEEEELDEEDLTFFQDFWSSSEAREESETNTEIPNSENYASLAASLFATEETVEEAPDFFQAASMSLESTSEIPTDSAWEEAAEFFQTASQSLETVDEIQEPETIYNEETPEDFEASASESESQEKPAGQWLENIASLDELVAELEHSILPWQRGDSAQNPQRRDSYASHGASDWRWREGEQNGESDEYVRCFPEENLLPQSGMEEEGPPDLSLGDTTLQRLQQDLSNLESATPIASEEDWEEATRIQFVPRSESSSSDREPEVPPVNPSLEEDDDDEEEGTVFLNTRATPGGKPLADPTTDASEEAANSSDWFGDAETSNATEAEEEDLLAELSAATPPESKIVETEPQWWGWESTTTETPTPSAADRDLFADLEAAAEADSESTSTSNGTNDSFFSENRDRGSGKKKPN